LSDPTSYASRIDTVLKIALNLDRDAKYEEFEVEIEKPKEEEKKSEEVDDGKKADL
jgi:hypothetical protein